MSEVTPEMSKAGQRASLDGPFSRTGAERVTAIYLAMKALDPEVERLRAALRAYDPFFFDRAALTPTTPEMRNIIERQERDKYEQEPEQ